MFDACIQIKLLFKSTLVLIHSLFKTSSSSILSFGFTMSSLAKKYIYLKIRYLDSSKLTRYRVDKLCTTWVAFARIHIFVSFLIFVAERLLSEDHFVDQNSQTPVVHLEAMFLSVDNFWTQIRPRAGTSITCLIITIFYPTITNKKINEICKLLAIFFRKITLNRFSLTSRNRLAQLRR